MVAAPEFIAFEDTVRLASGSRSDVALALKRRAEKPEHGVLLAFNIETGRQSDFDLHGSEAEVAERYADVPSAGEEPAEARGPGRPKLGVVAREVTLLPRHWEWLAAQPGGASVTLRKLVDAARRGDDAGGKARAAQEAAYQFMRVMAGNLPLYEEAARALFACHAGRFAELTHDWPTDVRDHARRLATVAFDAATRAI